MTPAQTKGQQPMRDILTDVRTQIGALTIAVNLLTAQLQKPERDRVAESARDAAEQVVALRQEIAAVRGRADTVSLVARKIDLMLNERCLSARGLARTYLECDK